MTRIPRTFWLLFAVTTAIYLVMLLWSVPLLNTAAGGLQIFDMRFLGYSEADAREFLAALNASGRAFYLGVQQRLDLPFPLLFGGTISFGVVLLFHRWSWLVRAALALLPLAGSAVDYVENFRISVMLKAPAGSLSAAQIAAASNATVLKFALYGFGGLSLLCGFGLLALARRGG